MFYSRESIMVNLNLNYRLSGRLDLLINQIQRNTEEDAIDNENVLIYKDEGMLLLIRSIKRRFNNGNEVGLIPHFFVFPDSANSEIEDEQSSSDEQWAEDDSEEEMDVN